MNCLGDVFDIDTGKQLAGILNEERTAAIKPVHTSADGDTIFYLAKMCDL